jgi:hypothetical protein
MSCMSALPVSEKTTSIGHPGPSLMRAESDVPHEHEDATLAEDPGSEVGPVFRRYRRGPVYPLAGALQVRSTYRHFVAYSMDEPRLRS